MRKHFRKVLAFPSFLLFIEGCSPLFLRALAIPDYGHFP
jgi:hypothetical protein